MRQFVMLGGSLLLAGTLISVGPALAAAPAPSLVITSPRAGATIHGSTVQVAVAVRNFKLMPPVLAGNPPVEKGYVGNIAYYLDSTSNFVPSRDLSGSTRHAWTNVPPGHHTVYAYFATMQHVPWPGGKAVSVPITVVAAGGGASSPGIGSAPTTGGAADMAVNPMNWSLLLAGALALLAGLAFLGRRFTFASIDSTGGRSAVPSPIPADPIRPTPARPAMEDMAEDDSPEVEASQPPALDVPAPLPPWPESDSEVEERPVAAVAPEVQQPPVPEDFGPVAVEPEVPRPVIDPSVAREHALQMAQQWTGVIESLLGQIEDGDAERRRMLEHIRVLEARLEGTQQVRGQIHDAASSISPEDLQTIRHVTNSLLRDPDHIVVLAAVAQQAGKLQALVESYATLRQSIDGL